MTLAPGIYPLAGVCPVALSKLQPMPYPLPLCLVLLCICTLSLSTTKCKVEPLLSELQGSYLRQAAVAWGPLGGGG